MKIVLASSSKFKKEIFEKVGYKIEIKENKFEEELKNNIDKKEKLDRYEYVKYLAKGKAESILNEAGDESVIIGLDTIVYSNNKILEKPKNLKEAKENLRLASDNINEVITGICMINKANNEIINIYDKTLIYFNNISEEDINYYLKNEENALNVSGFVVENFISNFVEKIDGSFYNILGVPVAKIYENLRKWNITLNN